MISFTFPENKTIFKGKLVDFYHHKGFKVSDIDMLKPQDNLITIKNVDYYFTYLNPTGRNKGGNSIILKLYESQSFDLEDIEYGDPDLILKILKFKKSENELFQKKSERRFLKEIDALKKCKLEKFQNIIEIFHHGVCKIYNSRFKVSEDYLFYTMEYAQYDLREYVEVNNPLPFEEKVSLCLSLSQGIDELRSLGYYYRDIKPDNIFISSGTWKIGDLGLLAERDEEEEIDDPNEFIGPRGWHSPEAMNKFLCEGKELEFEHNYVLDHQSDIFQLGKVFWYILQNNAPTGAFKQQDTLIKNNKIYAIIRTMLNYSKEKRFKNISEVIDLLKPLERQLQIAS